MSLGVAVICFIFDRDRILLMQASWAGNLWSVIGGKVEPGETPDDAVRREVWEETGLTLTDCRRVGHLLVDDDTSVHLYVSEAQTGYLRGSHEGEPVWWSIADALSLPMIDYVKDLLPLVRQSSANIDVKVQTRR